jgi:hypothetical protein
MALLLLALLLLLLLEQLKVSAVLALLALELLPAQRPGMVGQCGGGAWPSLLLWLLASLPAAASPHLPAAAAAAPGSGHLRLACRRQLLSCAACLLSPAAWQGWLQQQTRFQGHQLLLPVLQVQQQASGSQEAHACACLPGWVLFV